MKVNPLNIAASASLTANASTVDDSQQVLVQNTSSSGRYIHVEQGSTGTRIASFYLQPNQSVLVRKDYDDEIFASTSDNGTGAATDVLFTKTGFYA
tara:strand:+ start:144 stop:431 length:288 start_codon:yes stop_codon:yes gene_type:complete